MTVTPCPCENCNRPSSLSVWSDLNTVFELTPSTAAKSRAGGSREPGFASPSAMALRMAAATCS